ncbi:radical SAM protein [Cellulomonas sp. Marseille-Q8402]
MPSVSITIGANCNARCAHCCFSCGPKSHESLGDARITELVAEALVNDDVTEIGLSGGEALLRREFVLSLIRTIHSAGKRATLVTNGFWGQTENKARDELRTLRDAGLSSMTISYDDFHAAFIPPRRIANILNANKRVNLPCIVNIAVTRARDGNALIAELGNSTLRTRMTKFPVLPVGAGAGLPPGDIIRDFTASDALRCPGFEPVFHFDGKVYPCCSPAVFDSALSLGDASALTIADAQRKIRSNALLGVIRRVGFERLLAAGRETGVIDLDPRTPLVDACDLCRSLFADAASITRLTPLIIALYADLTSKEEPVKTAHPSPAPAP